VEGADEMSGDIELKLEIPEICVRELEELKEATKRLEELDINPKKAGKIVRTLADIGELTPEIFLAYIRYKRAKFDVNRCAFRYVVGAD